MALPKRRGVSRYPDALARDSAPDFTPRVFTCKDTRERLSKGPPTKLGDWIYERLWASPKQADRGDDVMYNVWQVYRRVYQLCVDGKLGWGDPI